jgi:hypothetical protein
VTPNCPSNPRRARVKLKGFGETNAHGAGLFSKEGRKMKPLKFHHILAIVFLLGCLMSALYCCMTSDAASPPTIPTYQPRAFYVSKISDLRNALDYARDINHPNTAITCDRTATFSLDEGDLLVQGVGTVLNGNGATFVARFTAGVPLTGSGIHIEPTLKAPVFYDGTQVDGLVGFPRGGAAILHAALGGNPVQRPFFNEFAPIRYLGMAEPTPNYPVPLCWAIVTPAQNIQILNCQIQIPADPNVCVGIRVYYSKKCLLQNVKVLPSGPDDSRGGTLCTGNTGLTVRNCTANAIGTNSGINETFEGNTSKNLGGEECVDHARFKGNTCDTFTLNDITCTDVTVAGNTMRNYLAVGGGQRILVVGNKVQNELWMGGDTTDCSVLNNTVNTNRFNDYSTRTKALQVNNSWQKSN